MAQLLHSAYVAAKNCDGLRLCLFLFRFTHHRAAAVICGWRRRVGMCEKVKPQTESCEAAGRGQTRGLPCPPVEHLTIKELPLEEPVQPWCVENSALQSAGCDVVGKKTHGQCQMVQNKVWKQRVCQSKPQHQVTYIRLKAGREAGFTPTHCVRVYSRYNDGTKRKQTHWCYASTLAFIYTAFVATWWFFKPTADIWIISCWTFRYIHSMNVWFIDWTRPCSCLPSGHLQYCSHCLEHGYEKDVDTTIKKHFLQIASASMLARTIIESIYHAGMYMLCRHAGI